MGGASKQNSGSGRNSWLTASPFCSADVRCNQVTCIEGRLPRLTPPSSVGHQKGPWGQERGTDSTLQSHLSFSSCMSLPPTLKAKMSLLVLTYLSFSLVRSGESWGPKRPGRRRAGGRAGGTARRQNTDNRGKGDSGHAADGQSGQADGIAVGCVRLECAPTAFSPARQAAEAGTLLRGTPATGQQSAEPMPPSHGEGGLIH